MSGLLRQWVNNTQGVTAIEFSLLSVPFMFFVVGIIELSFMFAGESILNGAVHEASRLIRTGQLQQVQSGDPRQIFSQALCRSTSVLLNCSDFQYEVKVLSSFADADMEPDIDDEGNLVNPPFDAGGVSDIVLVRVEYLYPLRTPGIGAFFADYPGNRKLLMTTTVFQTEPYDIEDGA